MLSQMNTGLHVKYVLVLLVLLVLFLSHFDQTLIFETDFSKNAQIYFHENSFSCSVRTDRHDKDNNRFSQFC